MIIQPVTSLNRRSENNKIIGRESNPVSADGCSVRIGGMRWHSQAFTIKLNKDVSLDGISSVIAAHNEWVYLLENNKDDTLKELTPARVTGTLDIPVGRLRKLN